MNSLMTNIRKDPANKKILITREFAAPVSEVWNAWTQPELLDQWWAPKPWKARTDKMDFRAGGQWLYSMVGPDGTEHHCRADYEIIDPGKSYEGLDAFCDKEGNINMDFPRMHWKCEFSPINDGTLVMITISFDSEADLNKIVEMGFEEGFTAAHGNLDELLVKK